MWKIRVNNLSQNHVVKSILQPAFYIHLVSTLHYLQEISQQIVALRGNAEYSLSSENLRGSVLCTEHSDGFMFAQR